MRIALLIILLGLHASGNAGTVIDDSKDDEAHVGPCTGSIPIYQDSDLDGHGDEWGWAIMQPCDYKLSVGESLKNDDCDDSDASISPSAIEVCDSIDNDCDGYIDDADSDVFVSSIWYDDYDGDGYGSNAVISVASCTQPANTVTVGGDCDDYDADVSPPREYRYGRGGLR